MPSFCFSAVVRTADPTLLLDTTHFLVQNSPSETIHKVRGNVPENVDVLLASDLVITLSGTLDHIKIPSADIAKSTVTLHFKRYLETNASQLGLSNIYIDEDDDIPKFIVTSVRSVPQGTRHPHATLLSIDIIFRWKSRSSKKGVDEEINPSPDSNSVNHTNPFSSPLWLPSQAILNTIIEKFVSVHLVKRYPLIFGLWCSKLDMEISFFTPIARAITNILERSPNDTLAKQGNRLIKDLRVQNIRAFDTSSVTLFNYLQTSGLIELPHSNDEEQMLNFHLTNQEVICVTMERLFKNGVPRSRFKGSTSIRSMTTDTDDFDEFNLNQSSSVSAMQADWSQGQDMALLWDDLALSSEPRAFPIIPAQDDRRHELLKHHNIDEYFLDDEGEWTQDGEGGWDWRTFQPLMPLDFDKNEAEPSDLEGSSPESSQDFLLTPPLSLSQSYINPDIIDTHKYDCQQISANALDHDRDSNRMAKSQDCGAEFIDPLNTSEYTNRQGQRSNPIAKEQRLLSEAQSISYDVGSISDSHSVLCHLDNDAPEIFLADEIHLGGDGYVCTAGTFNHLQSGNDMEAPNADPRSRAWEWGLLDFDM